MAPRSKVELLPASLKEWLDGALVAGGFAGYDALEAELNERLQAAGADFRVGKSSIHRYGSTFEEKLKTLKLVSEQARAVVAAAPDDEDAVSQALIRMTQEKLFTVLQEMEVDASKVNLSSLTKAIAAVSRASINNKKFATEVKARTMAAADAVTSMVKNSGLTPDAVDQIRRKILGIAE
jgi:hypothetical protein